MIGWEYFGPYDELDAQSYFGGYPFCNDKLKSNGINAISCHRIIDGGKDNIGNDIVVAGEGTGIVHIATGCGAIDNKIGKKLDLVELAPLDDESNYIDGFGWLTGKKATDKHTAELIFEDLKKKNILLYIEQYPHIYPHCWRSGDELVFRTVDEWYINMDWRDNIKNIVNDIQWIPEWGNERELEWLENMGDWMISKKRFWGLALPIWVFEDKSFYVVGSKNELKELAVEGWNEFENKSPHKPWIDKVKIKHPKTGLIGKRIPDVGNPWLDAGIVPYSTLMYNENKSYWEKWFPADFVVECFPGQFRNWFYSLLAMSTTMENKAPFKTLLGHALVKDETGKDMHKSWGNAIWFDDAAEKMGVDTMRWLYASQNTEHNLLFGYKIADEVRKNLITLWNTYSFFTTYAILDKFNPNDYSIDTIKLTVLDKWILAKTNQFIKTSEKYYKSYELYKLMKHSVNVLDDISNWYVRRNRRRFWKSENDSDKVAAYFTLYNVIIIYIKIMSPIIPFITDKIYQNLVKNIIKDSPSSIHLTDFPKFNKKLFNEKLIWEVDAVKDVVSLGRSSRNKANIKVRQPLSEINIFLKGENRYNINEYKDQIIQELNVKNVHFVNNVSDIVSYKVKPNFSSINKKYSDNKSEIISFINEMESEQLIVELNTNKKINLQKINVDLYSDDLIIDEIANDGCCVISNNNAIVSINTILSKDLIEEGIVRDLIRKIQNLRKESGLMVEDRINVSIISNNEIYNAIHSFNAYFLSEILGVKLTVDSNIEDFKQKISIKDSEIELGISKV